NGLVWLRLGRVLGIGLAFRRDHLDTRARTSAEVSHHLGLPVLARLPRPPRTLRRRRQLAVLQSPTSTDAEPFRVLCTNFEFTNLDLGARTIMVTSAREGEGKSTTAANLALAMASTGRHVALVDLDLRRPFLHQFFQIPAAQGLTNLVL